MSEDKKAKQTGREDHVVFLNMLTSARSVDALLEGCDLLKEAIAKREYKDTPHDITVVVLAPSKNTTAAELVISEKVEVKEPTLLDDLDSTSEPTPEQDVSDDDDEE